MKRRTVMLAAVVIGVGLSAGPIYEISTGPPESVASAAPLLVLRCSDSAGQQGKSHEVVVGGVEGLVLPDSNNAAGLTSIRGGDGRHYLIYKMFLAVSSAVSRFATVSILHPSTASMVYGSSVRIGAMSSSPHGEALVAQSRKGVRLPVCGSRFTGFVGGIIIVHPTCVTFQVSSPEREIVKTVVPIGTGSCDRAGELIETSATTVMSDQPKDERALNYINGRFGEKALTR